MSFVDTHKIGKPGLMYLTFCSIVVTVNRNNVIKKKTTRKLFSFRGLQSSHIKGNAAKLQHENLMVWVPSVAKQCHFCQLGDRQNEEHSHRPPSSSPQRCPQQVLGLHEVSWWAPPNHSFSQPPSQATFVDFRGTHRSLDHNLSYLCAEPYRQSVDIPKRWGGAHAWLCFREYFGV